MMVLIHHSLFTIRNRPDIQSFSLYSHLDRLPGAFFELIDGVEGFPAKLGAAEVPVGCRGAVVGLQQLEALDDGARAQIEHVADDLDELVVRNEYDACIAILSANYTTPYLALLTNTSGRF